MRSLETLIRVQRRQLDQLRRDLVALETLAEDLRGQAAALEQDVKTQQVVAKRGGPEIAFSYPNFAQWAIERRGRLAASIADVDGRLETTRAQVSEAFQDLKRFDIVLANRQQRIREEAARREQILLDEIGLESHRRKRA